MLARLAAVGPCTNHEECEAVCPKGISVAFIARMNADYLKASLTAGRRSSGAGDSAGG